MEYAKGLPQEEVARREREEGLRQEEVAWREHVEVEARKTSKALWEAEASIEAAVTTHMSAEGDAQVLRIMVAEVQCELGQAWVVEETLCTEHHGLAEHALEVA